MKHLTKQQTELVSSLAKRLGAIPGMLAVVLGGSHARGRAQQGSDIDFGLPYSDVAPFSIQCVRDLAEESTTPANRWSRTSTAGAPASTGAHG